MTTRDPPWEQNGLPAIFNIMWIASAKSRSVRRASVSDGNGSFWQQNITRDRKSLITQSNLF